MGGMRRFTVERLLTAMTLVALGVALLTFRDTAFMLLGGPLIGAGPLTPVDHPWLGAILGHC